jgi:hypothetical protein
MPEMFFVGIDGGKKGGITVLDSSANILICIPMPLLETSKGDSYDLTHIQSILTTYKPVLVYLEKAHTMPLNGAKANFTNGELYGMMQAVLQILHIPFEIVSAAHWQKEIFQGQTVRDTKAAAYEMCRNKWPQQSFLASERCKNFHDGMTDSACIALYNWRKNK